MHGGHREKERGETDIFWTSIYYIYTCACVRLIRREELGTVRSYAIIMLIYVRRMRENIKSFYFEFQYLNGKLTWVLIVI